MNALLHSTARKFLLDEVVAEISNNPVQIILHIAVTAWGG